MSELRSRPSLVPFKCVDCNALLAVVDGPSVVCPFCGASNVVPQGYRDELQLTRSLDSTTREAAAQWLQLARLKVPRWWQTFTALAPFVLLAGSLVILLGLALSKVTNVEALPLWLASAWVLLVPAQLLAAGVAMRNILVSGASDVGAAFAAVPAVKPDGPMNCRQCGAPLSVQPGDVLVRCLYCQAESIVQLDDETIETLRTRVAVVHSSLAQAMSALTRHAKLASMQTRGRTYLIAGLLVLPILWSMLTSWRSSYWSLLIALDVFVLAICVFWNVREAFLPPVTIETLEAVLETSFKNDGPELPGTRGWYDHSFDRINYLVPALVTLLFIVIQFMVVRGLS